MASAMLPLFLAGTSAASLFMQNKQSKKADQVAKQTKLERAEASGQVEERQRKEEFEERKQLGARRRIASLRAKGDKGSLFAGFEGVTSGPAEKQATLA